MKLRPFTCRPSSALGALLLCPALAVGCASAPEPLIEAQTANTHVKLDFEHRPLPDVPLPNDLATRFDATSPTGRRINASVVAPTHFERLVRRRIDTLDGWGVYAPVTVPFSGPLDIKSVIDGHHGDQTDFRNDVIYVIDVTAGSPTYGQPAPLDLGEGAFPIVLEKIDNYWKSDSRGDTISMLFDEHDEDVNANGKLDAGEDTDLDGILDKPNYLPGQKGDARTNDLVTRANATMTFYERETNTLIARPLVPLRERTTYAVVVTRRLKDASGAPVGSPFAAAHHLGQTEALRPLLKVLSSAGDRFGGLKATDVAFTWTFTTGTVTADLVAAREGLYGRGAQKHLQDEFPPDVELNRLWDDKPSKAFESLYTVSGETFSEISGLIIAGGLVSMNGKEQRKRFDESLKFVDRHVFGTYKTPRLFPRKSGESSWLDYNDQVWPADVATKRAEAYPEEVTFWMSLPRRDTLVDGKPRGVVILGHGYTGSKTEMFGFHSYFSQMGLAVLAIDSTSHGFDLDAKDKDQLLGVFGLFGLGNMAKALMRNRNWDQDLDGIGDSGADFWTAYTFHTRDVVRQTALDYSQLIRVLRAFDGKRTWPYDINGNGKADDLAGDFDGDGKVEVGGPDENIVMTGGSLGGIIAAVVGGLEPELNATAPIAGGGGLIDVGVRSIQGGVKEAVTLRVMGPLYVGSKGEAGQVRIDTIVPTLNSTATIPVAVVPAAEVQKLKLGGAVAIENVDNGEVDCALLIEDKGCVDACKADEACKRSCLTFRLHVASTVRPAGTGPLAVQPERHVLRFYDSNPFQLGVRGEDSQRACVLRTDAPVPVAVVDRFAFDINFHFQSAPLRFRAGELLSPLAEGLGLRRSTPGMRRFLGFAQMVLDAADPAVWAVHMRSGELKMGDGKVVDTHALVLNTNGDMNVPVNTGAAIGRSAGLIDFKKPIADWGGRTLHEVLIDTKVYEAVDKIPHFKDPAGNGVLFDVEDLSESATPTAALPPRGTPIAYKDPLHRGKDGFHVPRLWPPLSKHAIFNDGSGGVSGTFFPYVEPGGKHGFWNPGQHFDFLVKQCEGEAKNDTQKAACAKQKWFDHGHQIIGSLGSFLASGGKEFRMDKCYGDWSCPDLPKAPLPRK